MTHAERLGKIVKETRVADGYKTRVSFADAVGVSAKVLSEIENGRRDSYSDATLLAIDHTLEWAPGSAKAILQGKATTPMPDTKTAGTTYDTSEPLPKSLTVSEVAADDSQPKPWTYKNVDIRITIEDDGKTTVEVEHELSPRDASNIPVIDLHKLLKQIANTLNKEIEELVQSNRIDPEMEDNPALRRRISELVESQKLSGEDLKHLINALQLVGIFTQSLKNDPDAWEKFAKPRTIPDSEEKSDTPDNVVALEDPNGDRVAADDLKPDFRAEEEGDQDQP